MEVLMRKIVIFLITTVIFSSTVHAKEMAFKCDFGDGDIIFATTVMAGQVKVERTYEYRGTTVKVTIFDTTGKNSRAEVRIGSEVRPAFCHMASE
jgi:hypothetical protein